MVAEVALDTIVLRASLARTQRHVHLAILLARRAPRNVRVPTDDLPALTHQPGQCSEILLSSPPACPVLSHIAVIPTSLARAQLPEPA
jgi:hypothetical protein